MPKLEKVSRQQRIFRAKHNLPGDIKMDYILLPYGYAYNNEWLEAKKGDIIRFYDGADRRIFAVRKLKLNSPTVDILSRIRYGLTIKGALSRWKTNAILEGNYGRAISADTCLFVAFEKIEEDGKE